MNEYSNQPPVLTERSLQTYTFPPQNEVLRFEKINVHRYANRN